jgi:hypothetical protein
LSGDGERLLCLGWRLGDYGTRESVLIVLPAAERPSRSSLDRLTHEYGLKDELDKASAARPLELVRGGDRAMLVLEDPGGEPLDRLLGRPIETAQFLRIAISLVVALRRTHERLGSIQLTASGLLVVTVFGIIAILGRLRHWF